MIREHFSKHKWRYVIGGSLLFAAITVVILRKNTSLLSGLDPRFLSGPGGSGRIAVDNTVRSFSSNPFSRNSGNITINHNAVTTIHTGTRGHSGFMTRCVDTGELFLTQTADAKAFDISPSIMSIHLNKGVSLDQGLTFERVASFA